MESHTVLGKTEYYHPLGWGTLSGIILYPAKLFLSLSNKYKVKLLSDKIEKFLHDPFFKGLQNLQCPQQKINLEIMN